MTEPAPDVPRGRVPSEPIETKVIASSLLALAAAATVAVLNAAVADSALLGALPAWAQFIIVTIVPPIATAVAGYWTPHTPRPRIGPPPPHKHL